MTKKSLAELRALAKSMNLRGVSALRKQELAEVLSRQLAAADEGAAGTDMSAKKPEKPLKSKEPETEHAEERPVKTGQAAAQAEAVNTESDAEKPMKRKEDTRRGQDRRQNGNRGTRGNTRYTVGDR
ncbi:MAG: Rho termination factor N-terminal domain-containing protein, partial [Lachnospiraceae bacterium]|nr:Rho termination factor N-terminal domain-containing protein [Lachnospiraceae bacterium]